VLREPVPGWVVVEAGLRSRVEDRWRAADRQAGSGELAALRRADPELVREDSVVLAAALRCVLERLPAGGRALAVGHSPTNEAAVLCRLRPTSQALANVAARTARGGPGGSGVGF